MSAPKTIEIKVSEQQKAILEEISKSRTKAARLVERAKIILLGSEQVSGQEISEKFELSRSQVWVWRKRWSEVQGELEGISKNSFILNKAILKPLIYRCYSQ